MLFANSFVNINNMFTKILYCLEFLSTVFTRPGRFFVSYFVIISGAFPLKSLSTDVTRVSCGVSCLSVVGYVLRLDP